MAMVASFMLETLVCSSWVQQLDRSTTITPRQSFVDDEILTDLKHDATEELGSQTLDITNFEFVEKFAVSSHCRRCNT